MENPPPSQWPPDPGGPKKPEPPVPAEAVLANLDLNNRETSILVRMTVILSKQVDEKGWQAVQSGAHRLAIEAWEHEHNGESD